MSPVESNEEIIAEAVKQYSGFLVRGISKEEAVSRLIDILPNKLLVAITGESKVQISKYKADHSKINGEAEDAIFKFYQDVSETPFDLFNENNRQKDRQDFPLYTLEAARESYSKLRSALKSIDFIVNTTMKDSVKTFRGLRDNAPYKSEKDLPVITANDQSNSVIETSPNVSTFKVQNKKDFLAQQQQAEEQAQAEREKQAQIPKDKNGKPLKPVHFTTGETKDGQPMLSTDGGMTWYRKPNFPVRDLTVLMAWDDKKFEGMDKYLTMKDRLIGELMQSLDSILIPQSETEWQKTRNQAYDQHPAAFWKMYFKYGADDNFTLRQSVLNLEAMRKSSLGNPFFKTVEELHEFEDKMERYLTTHKSDFAPEDVAKYFDRDEDAMNIDGSYVAADEDEPINEVEYNTLYNFNGPYNKLF